MTDGRRIVSLQNASAYRPLSASKASEITDMPKHDTPFVVCLFPVANGALIVQKV